MARQVTLGLGSRGLDLQSPSTPTILKPANNSVADQQMKAPYLFVFGIALCSLLTPVKPAFAQGTALTYQGRLNGGGNPASGSYDLSFSLYGSGSGGSAVAGPVV